jgi:heme/copper-type cytochrome/quinol oxidase subunit 2
MYYPREAQRDFLFTRAVMLFVATLVLALMLWTLFKIYRHKEEDRQY